MGKITIKVTYYGKGYLAGNRGTVYGVSAARLLMNYIQFCYHLFPVKIFKEDRADYILSLQQAQDDETSQPFLDFMAGQLKKSLSLEIQKYKDFHDKGFSFMF